MTKNCAVGECGSNHYARGWCIAHYRRVKRDGDVRADVPVRSYGSDTCSVDECGRKHEAHGWCYAHYRRWYEHGDVRPEAPIVGSTDPAYRTVHQRIARQRGAAPEHTCVDCGRQAEEWSYNHGDPDERLDERERPYSNDLDHYDPRCRSCHRILDHEKSKQGA